MNDDGKPLVSGFSAPDTSTLNFLVCGWLMKKLPSVSWCSDLTIIRRFSPSTRFALPPLVPCSPNHRPPSSIHLRTSLFWSPLKKGPAVYVSIREVPGSHFSMSVKSFPDCRLHAPLLQKFQEPNPCIVHVVLGQGARRISPGYQVHSTRLDFSHLLLLAPLGFRRFHPTRLRRPSRPPVGRWIWPYSGTGSFAGPGVVDPAHSLALLSVHHPSEVRCPTAPTWSIPAVGNGCTLGRCGPGARQASAPEDHVVQNFSK